MHQLMAGFGCRYVQRPAVDVPSNLPVTNVAVYPGIDPGTPWPFTRAFTRAPRGRLRGH
jgi:hypothetical protein